jgi:predicted permease
MSLWKWLFHQHARDEELDEEIQAHLRMAAQERIGLGETAEQAKFSAAREFGNIVLVKEITRDVWGFRWLETLWQDIRYGLRGLRKNPGLTAVVVLSLALGIGANTAIFSLIDAVMLKMLPVENPEQLRLLSWASPTFPDGILNSLTGNMDQDGTGRTTSTSFPYPAFEQIRTRNEVFSSVFAFAVPAPVTVVVDGQAQLAEAELVSGDYFSGLNVEMVTGRPITEADDAAGAAPVAIISHGYWERRFGREPSVVGRSVTINNILFTIAGVSSAEFFGIQPGRAIDVWLPLHMQPQVEPRWTEGGRSKFIETDDWWVCVMGRLKPAVGEQQARAALDGLFQQSFSLPPQGTRASAPPQGSSKGDGSIGSRNLPHIELASASKGLNYLRQRFSKPLFMLMGIVGLVLLIACANVANLLLARAATRQREAAVRLAIGAGRRRLIRQWMTESVLLSGLGGGFGLILAFGATRLLVAFIASGREPITLSVRPDLHILAFTLGLSVMTGILFGLAPAFRSTQIDLTVALKEAGAGLSAGTLRGRRRPGLGKVLVLSQVAMSLLLLVGAGLFVRTLRNLENLNAGFNRRNILLFGIDATQEGYKGDRLAALYQELERRIAALPGVRSVSESNHALITGNSSFMGFSLQGSAPKPNETGRPDLPGVYFNGVGPRFFETMGIPVLLGRALGPGDTFKAPKVAVINQTLARKYFGSSNPIGRRFGFGDAQSSGDVEIVGVVGDAKYTDLRQDVPPTVYGSYLQNLDFLGEVHFEVRTAGDPLAMVPAVRRAVRDVDKNLPLSNVKTQVQQIDQTLFQERLFARLSSLFGLLALTMACVGLYGTMTYAVTRRTNEIGVRLALGADPGAILRSVMGEVLALAAVGVAIGALAALAAGRLIASMLFGLKPADPSTLAGAALLMIAVAAISGYIPARRAAKVDPMVALRYE